jgi:four helix bundle protein
MAVDHLPWERRQAELWDRVFQATQDVAALADSMGKSVGEGIVREELVRAACQTGAELVRANAAHSKQVFLKYMEAARLKAIETDYWLRLGYLLQNHESLQRDVSNLLAQYSQLVEMLHSFIKHAEQEEDVIAKHTVGPRVT